ncbi:hypothetical protein ACTGUZ_06855 [Streptococcus suis]
MMVQNTSTVPSCTIMYHHCTINDGTPLEALFIKGLGQFLHAVIL